MTFFKTPEKLKTLAMILMTVEVLLYAFSPRPLHILVLPIVLILLSLASGGLVLYLAYFKPSPLPIVSADLEKNARASGFYQILSHKQLPIFLHILGLIILSIVAAGIIKKYPPDVAYSDIIPQVKVLVTRFWSGQMPYAPIYDWGWEMFPTYMPFQWLPFSIPELLGVDYRFFAIAVWGGIILWILHTSLFKQNTPAHKLLFVILPFVFLFGQSHIFNATYEVMIAGYYVFMLYALRSPSLLFRAVAISVCLLSRYSLVLFVPFYLVYMLMEEGFSKTLRMSLWMLAMGLVFYVLPFMSRDPLIFFKSYNYHSLAALGEWKHFEGGELPIHLSNKLGIAVYFYKFSPGDLTDKLKHLQQVHLILCLFTSFLLLGGYYLGKRANKIHIPLLFLIGAFKIYIGIFYSFIQIPYEYLFTVPVFCTIASMLYMGNFRFQTSETLPAPITPLIS